MTIAGPTLNGYYPQAGFQFGKVRDQTPPCGTFVLDDEVPVARVPLRVVGIEPRDQEPPGDPVFLVVDDPPACEQGGVEDVGDCLGAVLEPLATAGVEQGCTVAVTSTYPATDHRAELGFELEARCTAVDLYPCDSPDIIALEPSMESPVIVTLRSTVPLLTCPEDPEKVPGGGCSSSYG